MTKDQLEEHFGRGTIAGLLIGAASNIGNIVTLSDGVQMPVLKATAKP